MLQNSFPHFRYKQSQQNILMQKVCGSGFISIEQLKEIEKLYHPTVPYHNFLHALCVAEASLQLSEEKYTLIERKSLFFAALFHDAGHEGTAQDLDEFRSLDYAFQEIQNFEKKYDLKHIDIGIIRKAIIGTVFKNRAKNTNPYAITLADLDVATVGMSFEAFLFYADIPFSLESKIELSTWLTDVNYFKFLMNVDKNIFRNPEIREIFPHAHKNIKRYIEGNREKIQILYDIWI